MRTLKIITIAILAITAVALATATVFAYMGRPGYYTPNTTSTGTGTTGTYANNPIGATTYSSYYGGMMGGYRGGCGGMRAQSSFGAPAYTYPTTASPLNISTAVTIAQNYVASTGNTNLEVSQVEEYTLNFYVLVKEKNTGMGAFEVLVDKYTGLVSAEMGPNMMWNTKYGMRNGMMGWLIGTPTIATITAEQAKANAQQYLNTYYHGTSVEDAQAFYGYYHFEVLSSGSNVYGMLSVNSYTGQVWYHTWHGTFIQEIEFG